MINKTEISKQTAVEFLADNLHYLHSTKWEDILIKAKEMEKNSYICSKCKSQINGNEVMQQMQGSEKSD